MNTALTGVRRYAVSLVGLKSHRVYEALEGKESAQLDAALRRRRGQQKVKIDCMNRCPPFRSMVTRLFPRVQILAERFHVIRLVIDPLLDAAAKPSPLSVLSAARHHDSAAQERNPSERPTVRELLGTLLRDKLILHPAYVSSKKSSAGCCVSPGRCTNRAEGTSESSRR